MCCTITASLVMSAAVEAYDLYREGHHANEFARTVSRLIEMRSRIPCRAAPDGLEARDHNNGNNPVCISDADTAAAPICSPWRDTPAPPSLLGQSAVADVLCRRYTTVSSRPASRRSKNIRASRICCSPVRYRRSRTYSRP